MVRNDQARTNDLAHGVARLSRRLRQERRSDLTASQLSVLGALRTLGPVTPGTVAAHERVQPPTITRMLNSLVDHGLVLRAPHPDDGRQVLVSLADKGEAVLAEERERRDEWLAAQVAGLTADDRAVLFRAAALLQQIADA